MERIAVTKERKEIKHQGLYMMVIAGGIAGVGFNVALGSFAWNLEGILGGLLSGLLIYVVS
jgi:hypothetical protein